MEIKWFSSKSRPLSVELIVCLALMLSSSTAGGGTPDWLRAAARSSMPPLTDETDAVVLLDETVTVINSDGDMKEIVRRAYKILRPSGQNYGIVSVYFDSDTRVDYVRAWSIPASGAEYEVKEKETIETSILGEALYEDVRMRSVKIPASLPGSVVGYEFSRRRRPQVLQSLWFFQHEVPTKRARFILQLPSNWEFEPYWRNYQPTQPSRTPDHRLVWELNDIPGLEIEKSMPAWRALAASLNLAFHPAGGGRTSWRDVGTWFAGLAVGSQQATPEIRAKVAELTAGPNATRWSKLDALARFVQQNIRYVAIETGIGGYTPHAAADVFQNRYGDCKDKATLLGVMLREAGWQWYYVLLHADRGVTAPDFPSMLAFNHVIVAITVPNDVVVENAPAMQTHPVLGRLMFFDPTDFLTPLGYLAGSTQGSDGLIVGPSGGELLRLPIAQPTLNRLLRGVNLTMTEDGTLSGLVREVRFGAVAISKKAAWRMKNDPERQAALEDFAVASLGNASLSNVKMDELNEITSSLVVDYAFSTRNYAQNAGTLLLFRPCVLGKLASDLLEGETRKQPVEFDYLASYSDVVNIRIPPAYVVDELPPAVDVSVGVAEYHSKVTTEPGVLHYVRTLTIKELRLPLDRLEDMRQLYRKIAADERSTVVLKRAGQ